MSAGTTSTATPRFVNAAWQAANYRDTDTRQRLLAL